MNVTPIHPKIKFSSKCPSCKSEVRAQDWVIPGMFVMGKFKCYQCELEYLADLPYSLGMISPAVLNLHSSIATSSKKWYANLLTQAYRKRNDEYLRLEIARSPSCCECLFVNTLYPCFGDAVSLLLRINGLRSQKIPIVVLINSGLEWLVPDWVDGIWVVNIPFSENSKWNIHLTEKIKEEAGRRSLSLNIPNSFQSCRVFAHELRDFTKIDPFPRENWLDLLIEKPVVTFIWRTDRTWPDHESYAFINHSWLKLPFLSKIWRRLRIDPIRRLRRSQQIHHIRCLADELRNNFPNMEFAVCGLDRKGKLPVWIRDLRTDSINDSVNKSWAHQAARSHIVFGVLGSHTVIPGALSGAYIELVPKSHCSNILTTAPIRSSEVRESLFTYRLIPADVKPQTLANIVIEIMLDYPYFQISVADKYYEPLGQPEIHHLRESLAQRQRYLESMENKPASELFN